MLLQLNLRDRRNDPLSFLSLLKEIHEEDHETAKQSLRKPMYRQPVHAVQIETEKEPMDLKAEVQELKAQFTEQMNKLSSIANNINAKKSKDKNKAKKGVEQ